MWDVTQRSISVACLPFGAAQVKKMVTAKGVHQKHLDAQQRRSKQAQAMAEKRLRIDANRRGLFMVDMKHHPGVPVTPASSLAKELPGLVQGRPYAEGSAVGTGVCHVVQHPIDRYALLLF